MWKKLVLLGGLFACLGLPAFAAADVIDKAPVAKKTIPVELKGKLLRTDRSAWETVRVGWQQGDPSAILWQLAAPDQVYELDLDNKHDLWVLAEKSVGQTVLVKGTWDGDRLHVASLKADPEHVKKTIKVEVKGRLIAIYPMPEARLVPAQAHIPRDFPPYDAAPMWQINVGDKVYALNFEGAEGLTGRARELDGRTVILTGVLENDTTIRVADLKADDEYFRVTETKAEVKGKLQYVITHFLTGEVVMVCDAIPEHFSRSWSLNYGFVVDGKTYILDLHGDKQLEADAKMFLGQTVTASGVLNGDRLKADRLESDDIRFWLEQVPCESAK